MDAIPAAAPVPDEPPVREPARVPVPGHARPAGSPAASGPGSAPGPVRDFAPEPGVVPPVPLARRLAPPLATMAGVAAAFAYVGAIDPNEPGHYPVCPLLRLTGIYCPGCGGLRSAHAFIHGDLGAALGSNAIATVGYVVFGVVWAVWLARAVRDRPVRIGVRPALWWALGGVLLVFTVVRNLPFGAVLAP
ncbi:DUF2752 domain-containing protein [Streptomyces sp. NPDC057445]|uniref:DUF2752 domain-containing protein n=1 Tax=Streptomyces sp. NPDC057445 TaxID=3346136 RepID=UPI0036A1F5E8